MARMSLEESGMVHDGWYYVRHELLSEQEANVVDIVQVLSLVILRSSLN